MDPGRNRFSKLLHRGSSGESRRTVARLLRLDVVSTADELRRHRAPTGRVSSADASDHAANGAVSRISSAHRQTGMARAQPDTFGGYLVDAFKSYSDPDRVHRDIDVSGLRLATIQFPPRSILRVLVISIDARVLLSEPRQVSDQRLSLRRGLRAQAVRRPFSPVFRV